MKLDASVNFVAAAQVYRHPRHPHLRHLLLTTATPPFKGCFCLKLVPVKCDAKAGCSASWESSK